MEKNDFEAIELGKGAVRVYDLGAARLHAYQTNDPLADEVFVVERGGRGFVIELPCFRDNIAELEAYVRGQDIAVEGIVAAYHMAGGSFMPGTPVYSTGEAEAYGHEGGGKALVDGFAAAFGEAFDASVAQVTNLVEGDELELAGVRMRLVRNADAFDLELPELGAAYLHMLGHDCHSIVAGPAHADAQIAQLQGLVEAGIDLILTSHYTPEDLKDARTKIAYLKELKRLAAASTTAEGFKAAVDARFPSYGGANYLDMTAGLFFA